MIAVDSSAVIAALVGSDAEPALIARLGEAELHAPHLLDAEVLHALRGLVRGRQLTLDRANDARLDFASLTVLRYPLEPLAARAWELRDNLTVYDAMFVALAEQLDAPLVTCDARLARAPGVRTSVELFAAG